MGRRISLNSQLAYWFAHRRRLSRPNVIVDMYSSDWALIIEVSPVFHFRIPYTKKLADLLETASIYTVAG